MQAVLRTPRLRLREFSADDLDALAAMVADEEQMRFYRRPRTREDAAAWIDHNVGLYDAHGFGFWLIESRPSSEFVGYCGIRPLVLGGTPTTEIGWHTTKTSWNRGLATEAAGAVRAAAFRTFGRSRLVALVPPGHVASRRVAEKIGMREGSTVTVEGEPYATYEIVRP